MLIAWPFFYMEETLKAVADTTLETPDVIEVDIQPQSRIETILQKWGVLPKKRVFELKPVYYGTLIRISKLLLSLKFDTSGDKSMLESNYQAIIDNGEALAEIIALAIQNDEHKVKPGLKKLVLNNFTAAEMGKVLPLVVKRMDLTNFMLTIISAKGLNVLAMNKPVIVENAETSEVSP